MNPSDELQRIDKYKEYKRLNADTFQNTTKLFEVLAREKLALVRELTAASDDDKAPQHGEGYPSKPSFTPNLHSEPDEDAEEGGEHDPAKAEDRTEKRKKKVMKESAFKGFGLMKFDDFNYSAFNSLVFKLGSRRGSQQDNQRSQFLLTQTAEFGKGARSSLRLSELNLINRDENALSS